MVMQLPVLNFPHFEFKMKEQSEKAFIFDPCRRKYVPLSPEEWVRQHCIAYLHFSKGFPLSVISVERAFILNYQTLRYDLVAYSNNAKPVLLVECKAPSVKITSTVFDQIAVYNLQLHIPFLYVTNGLEHYVCQANLQQRNVLFVKELPNYKMLADFMIKE